jgi:hypothetical protein
VIQIQYDFVVTNTGNVTWGVSVTNLAVGGVLCRRRFGSCPRTMRSLFFGSDECEARPKTTGELSSALVRVDEPVIGTVAADMAIPDERTKH